MQDLSENTYQAPISQAPISLHYLTEFVMVGFDGIQNICHPFSLKILRNSIPISYNTHQTRHKILQSMCEVQVNEIKP